jgi:CHAD domain-containing protein
VIHPKLDSDKTDAMKFLNKMRKATGKLRDSEVHLDLLDNLDEATGKEKKKVKRALKVRRKAARNKLDSLLSDADLKIHLKHLRLIGEPPLASREASEKPLPAADQLALDEYRSFVESRAPLSPENLHSYRLACKGFRYKAELAGDTPQARALIDAWKSVQDVSGNWHDYLTLSELTQEVCGDCTLHSLLVGMRDKNYEKSVAAVETAERQLLASPDTAKKRPSGVSKNQRRSSVA